MSERRARPRLEILEGREVPGQLTVTLAAASHTLAVVGDAANNNVTFEGDAADPTHFTLSSSVDTFNGSTAHTFTQSGVRNIAIRLQGGDDAVGFLGGVPIHLAGGLTIDGGDGANGVNATELTVGGGFTIRNGSNTAGTDTAQLTNLNVGGALTILNGDGDTDTTVDRNSIGISTVRGSVSVTNGTGSDTTNLEDLNVGGSVTVRNGHGNAGGFAGQTQIFNNINPFRSVVRGNVSFSNLDGDATDDGLWDVDVGGNVTLAEGSGSFNTFFDGNQTQLPVLVRGSVSITGTGADVLTIGTNNKHTGLIVGHNLTITAGAGNDSLSVNRLQVGGATRLSMGDGSSTVTIDDSLFAGTFTLTTGAGTDTLNVDTLTGTTAETIFEKAFLVRQGEGTNSATLGGGADTKQSVVFGSTAVIHHGKFSASLSTFPQDYFPFGTKLQWIN